MNITEAYEYIERAYESEGEQRAEYGSGCVSLGLDPYDWSPAYDGYRTSDDPDFIAANKIVDAYEQTHRLVTVTTYNIDDTDIPF